MAVAIGIWLALLGYTVAWAGWRNLDITYSPQTDGSVVPSSAPVGLLDAFTCRTPTSKGSESPPSPGGAPGSSSETPMPTPAPLPTPTPGGILGPIAILQPAPPPNPLPGFPRPPTGLPQPGGLTGVLGSIELGLRSLVGPVIAGLRL